jgi:hypothetical protein
LTRRRVRPGNDRDVRHARWHLEMLHTIRVTEGVLPRKSVRGTAGDDAVTGVSGAPCQRHGKCATAERVTPTENLIV